MKYTRLDQNGNYAKQPKTLIYRETSMRVHMEKNNIISVSTNMLHRCACIFFDFITKKKKLKIENNNSMSSAGWNNKILCLHVISLCPVWPYSRTLAFSILITIHITLLLVYISVYYIYIHYYVIAFPYIFTASYENVYRWVKIVLGTGMYYELVDWQYNKTVPISCIVRDMNRYLHEFWSWRDE
jgi:hypothetical protein